MDEKPPRVIKRKVRPKSWTVQFKILLNQGWEKVTKKQLFTLPIASQFGPEPAWQQKVAYYWNVFYKQSNLAFAVALLIVCFAILGGWRLYFPDVQIDLRVEFWGLIFDIFFILIVFSFFEYRRQRSQNIQHQQEIIDDYKRWDSPEAHFRIAGAIRRLNKQGIFALDLAGIRLTNFSFSKCEIGDITGSTFYDGTWGKPLLDKSIELTNVSFDHVECCSVQFSPYEPLYWTNSKISRHAKLIDCSFFSATLKNAVFNGAQLEWTSSPPNAHYEYVLDGDEESYKEQLSYGPFFQANLAGASFIRTKFKYADFRDAEGVLEADFTEAIGLEDAVFDSEVIKNTIMSKFITVKD